MIAKIESTGEGHKAIVKITNKLGLHLRPASKLVKLASQYDACEVTLSKDGQAVNAKSIMGVIMLAAEQGSELIVECCGENSEDALKALIEMIETGFGEG
jgi:phosphocarrier protein